MNAKPQTRAFISHSSKDRQVVQALVELVERAAVVPPGILRCTSLPGYDLDLGTRTADALRSDFSTCRLLVGVITRNSLTAPWVLFELGAAWAQGLTAILLLSPSVKFSDIEGPFGGHNHARLDDERAMTAFLDQIIVKLQLQRRVGTLPRLVDEFTRLARYPGDDPESEILRSLREFHQEDRIPGSAYLPVNDLQVFRQLRERHGTVPPEYMHAINRLLASKRVIAREDDGSPVITLNPEYSG